MLLTSGGFVIIQFLNSRGKVGAVVPAEYHASEPLFNVRGRYIRKAKALGWAGFRIVSMNIQSGVIKV